MAARTVMFINYVAHAMPNEAEEYIAKNCRLLQEYLVRGQLLPTLPAENNIA